VDARLQGLFFDPAALDRLSTGLITSHQQNGHGGAVKRFNAIRTHMSSTAFATAPGFQHTGLEREEPIATNSMLLHEPYFGSLGLAPDMYEPAYHVDHGAAAGAHVDAFMGDVHWTSVCGRYRRAVHAASEPSGASQDEIGDALVFDVRRAGVFEQARTMIPGARWCDPSAVAPWCADLPANRDAVVHCVDGHEVGRATAMQLRAAGVNARCLRGGIDGWQSAQRPVVDKPAGQMP
jgi:rhodanese-related sulfurtransferase